MAWVILTTAFVAITAAWVVRPLLRSPAETAPGPASDHLNNLLEAKHAVYRSMLDLDFDLKVGKVSEEDYKVMRAQHEAEALKILAEIDAAGWSADALELEIAAARDRLRN